MPGLSSRYVDFAHQFAGHRGLECQTSTFHHDLENSLCRIGYMPDKEGSLDLGAIAVQDCVDDRDVGPTLFHLHADIREIMRIVRNAGRVENNLRNRFYIGEVKYKDDILPGEQPPIMDRALFEAVQQKLTDQWTAKTSVRNASNHLLIGLLFDDAGYPMAPTHATKAGIRYRYYVSRPCLMQAYARLTALLYALLISPTASKARPHWPFHPARKAFHDGGYHE